MPFGGLVVGGEEWSAASFSSVEKSKEARVIDVFVQFVIVHVTASGAPPLTPSWRAEQALHHSLGPSPGSPSWAAVP